MFSKYIKQRRIAVYYEMELTKKQQGRNIRIAWLDFKLALLDFFI